MTNKNTKTKIKIDRQRVTWTAIAILAMFTDQLIANISFRQIVKETSHFRRPAVSKL